MDEQELKRLEKNIQMLSKRNTFDTNVSVAEDFLSIYKITKDEEKVREAINFYTKALDLNSDAIIFCERSKAFSIIGESDKAVDDFRQAQALSTKEGVSGIKATELKTTLKEIASLDSVKEVIHKMRAENKLPSEFLTAFEELTNTTQRMIAKIAYLEDKIQEQGELIREMGRKMQEMQQQMSEKAGKEDITEITKNMEKINEAYSSFDKKTKNYTNPAEIQKAIDELKTELKGLGVDLKEVSTKVQEIDEKLEKLIHHSEEEFKKIKKRIKNMKEKVTAFDGKFQCIEGEINSIKDNIFYIDETLKETLYPRKELQEKFKVWEKENPLLYLYANNFYWVLNNYLLSYRIASTGVFEAKNANPSPSNVEEYFPTALEVVCKGLSFIPFVSEIIDTVKTIIEKVFEFYQERKSEVIITKINNVIRKYVPEENVSTAVGQGVIALCQMEFKLSEIDDLKNGKAKNEKNFFKETIGEFYDQVDFAIKKWNNYKIDDKGTEIYKLVVEDVTALLVYILESELETNNENPILASISEGFKGGYESPICKKLEDRYKDKKKELKVKENAEEKILSNGIGKDEIKKVPQTSEEEQECKCVIY